MVMSLMMYALNKMAEKGYTPFIPPTLVKGLALFGSGYFKGAEYNGDVDEIYQIATSDKESDGSKLKNRNFSWYSRAFSLAYYSGETLKKKICQLKFADLVLAIEVRLVVMERIQRVYIEFMSL